MQTRNFARMVARTGAIAALYAGLCLVLAPLSYGPVQVRVSEALTLLPVLCPQAVVGVTLGCFIANALASAPLDMLVGTVATLLAALATRRLRHLRFKGVPVVASLPPVLFNAVLVGAELSFLYLAPGSPAALWLLNMLYVGAGQLVSCCGLGLLLIYSIERNPTLQRLFAD